MPPKKKNENYFVNKYFVEGVRIWYPAEDDGTTEIKGLFYLIIRGEPKSTHLRMFGFADAR